MNPTFVAIVDYRSGNLASLVQAFKCIGVHSEIISSPSHFYLKPFTHLVLPGVGSFDLCRERLSTSSFDNFLLTIAAAGIIPILGICVGMQLLASSSAEGSLSGLSLIPGKVQSFSKLNSPFLPHLGWNVALPLTANIFPSLSSNKYFYFIHSYFFDTDTFLSMVGFCSSALL